MSAAVATMPQAEAQTLHDFYTDILPTQGRYVLFTLPNARHCFVDSIDAAVTKTLELEKSSTGAVYQANASYGAENLRTQNNVVSIKSCWLDIDCGSDKAAGGKGYPTKKHANAALSQFIKAYALPTPTYVIDSGNGLHVYWALTEDVTPTLWKSTATQLDILLKHAGLLVDPSRTKDSASILRPPCTMNRKDPVNPKPVKVKHKGRLVSFEAFDNAIKTALAGVSIGASDSAALQHVIASQNDDLVTASASNPEQPYPYRENREDFYNAICAAYPNPSDRANWLTGLSALAYLVVVHGWDADEVTKIRQAWEATASNFNPSNLSENESQWQDMLKRTHEKLARGDSSLITHLTVLKKARENGWKPEAKELDALSAVQVEFALIQLAGSIFILDKSSLNSKGINGAAQPLQLSKRQDGQLLITRKLTAEFAHTDKAKLVQRFLNDAATTLYKGIEFNPQDTTEGMLNLWVGATITPKQGSWSKIYSLLHDVLCGGRETEYQYLIKYLAHALQMPWEKPGVMITMIGGQGTGKGTFARILQKIWSATYLHTNNIKQVVGDFNGSLERSFIVFLDEALFAGDRASSDRLKSIVTEQTISIAEKYQPSRQINSVHRIFAATNADWFKSVERDDRRDFVLRVSNERKGDTKFWNEVNSEIAGDGVNALVYDLLQMDLSGFNVRAKPNTRELSEQKIQSLDKFPRWWHDCLWRGYVSTIEQDWKPFIATQGLVAEFDEATKGARVYNRMTARDVAAHMRKLCPSAQPNQISEKYHRTRGWILPDLEIARKEFESFIGDSLDWGEAD